VKAPAFDYVRATSPAHAIALLAEHGDAAKLIAGGQSLLPALNLRLSAPSLLIDIGRLPELQGIHVTGGRLRIGAGSTHAALLAHELVAEHAPLIARALAHVAHPAIRTRGTIGGSLANADPAAELPACALALGATMVVQGPGGERRVAAESFFTGLFETALAADELLVAVEIPLAPGARWGFAELSRRSGDYAMIGLAAQAADTVRLAFFSAGTTAILARHAAAALPTGIEAAAAALAADLPDHSDLQATAATRLHLARVLLRRVAGGWTDARAAA
jgi:carbon-monoxide dehydrogenase medium subunit